MRYIDHRAFIDEMEKIATRLNSDERRQQSLMYTGLGALTGPVIGGISNFIQHGKISPASKIPLRRWIPATMATGALVSGAIPFARKAIDNHLQDRAKARLEDHGDSK